MFAQQEAWVHTHWCRASTPADPSGMLHPRWENFQDLGETVAEMSQHLIDKDGQLEGVMPKGGTLPKEEDTAQIVALPPNDDTVFVSKSEFPGGQYELGT